jgi:hypothetical protein
MGTCCQAQEACEPQMSAWQGCDAVRAVRCRCRWHSCTLVASHSSEPTMIGQCTVSSSIMEAECRVRAAAAKRPRSPHFQAEERSETRNVFIEEHMAHRQNHCRRHTRTIIPRRFTGECDEHTRQVVGGKEKQLQSTRARKANKTMNKMISKDGKQAQVT